MLFTRNSEIYNHEEVLRTALSGYDTSWTTSDSVVLGYLYQKLGPVGQLFELLDGIFCGVLYDEDLDQFLAFRDPIGICPLYWGRSADGAIWFASEMKALQDCCVDLDVFPPVSERLLDGETAGRVPYRQTFYELPSILIFSPHSSICAVRVWKMGVVSYTKSRNGR